MPADDIAKERASKILGSNKESEFLQSYVRLDTGIDDDKSRGKSSHKRHANARQVSFDIPEADRKERGSSARHVFIPPKLSSKAIFKQIKKEMKEKEVRSRKIVRDEEVYTDKDRAAAVNMGSTDIKQSLNIKQKADRSKALQIPDEADPSTLMALGRNELRAGNTEIALNFVNKALELNPEDKNALVARSKCYLLLGEPKLALDDAETALVKNKNYVKAIYQKAEALYYLGDFELSLMFYHRGLRIRPELEGFRLGVQKAQEAIENTIGSSKPLIDLKDIEESLLSTPVQEDKTSRKTITPTKKTNTSKKPVNPEKKLSRQLLGQLCVDKEYLENLLKHPDLNVADRKTNSIAIHAEEAVQFLNKRQEFWRQQRPTTTAACRRKAPKINDLGPFPKWYAQNQNI